MTTTATPPTTRPCACWARIAPATHGGHCCFGLEAPEDCHGGHCCFGLEAPEDCHDDVIAEASRSTGRASFYRLPPGEKRDVLAQAVARLYPTGQP